MSGGYTVDSEELRAYSKKLSGQSSTASGIAGLVEQADVSEQSWGVVGLFVKGSYTEMLNELRVMFSEMERGLEQGAEKFDLAANGYDEREQEVRGILEGIRGKIDGG